MRQDSRAAFDLAADEILARFFREVPVALAIYDLEGEPRRTNDAHDAFAEALGTAAGLGECNALTDLRSERGGHREPFERALLGEVQEYRFELRPPAGTRDERSLQFVRILMPGRDAHGAIVAVFGLVLDVTERLRAAEEKARLREQLLEAQKAESLALLAGGVAHDFNNLLVGVLGNASLALALMDDDSELRKHVEAIELAARRAGELARQLLAYSGKGKFREEEIELSRLVQETAEVLRVTIAGNAELCLELAPHLSCVKADATQVRQIVMNLITNARDAVQTCGGRITVRTGEVSARLVDVTKCVGNADRATQQYVFVEVQDTGVGMDAETASKIFDPFFSTKFTGRGLGLSAALGIVGSHRGLIGVESRPGEGTSMRVYLPAIEREADTREVLTASLAAPVSDAMAHVLVVDDEAAVRTVLRRVFRAMNCAATCVATGAEALELLETGARAVSCVFLDLTMPGQSGPEVFELIRAQHPTLPVVFMSGYDAQSAPQGAGFLHKPFTMSDVRRSLSEALANRRE